VVQRARRLQRYLTQPFHAMTSQNAAQGVSVPLVQTLTDCEAILGGEYDDLRKVFLEGAGFGLLLDQLWPMALIGTATLAAAGWLFRHRMY
jgi:hypothetical protein